MLGSMIVSSASGVLRRRPRKAYNFELKNISYTPTMVRLKKQNKRILIYQRQVRGYLATLCRRLTRVRWSQRFFSEGPARHEGKEF